MQHLDAIISRLEERLLHEQLMEAVPSVRDQNEQNKRLVALLHRLATIFQRHQLTVAIDPMTGKTYDGHDPKLAQQECTEAIKLISMLAVMYQ